MTCSAVLSVGSNIGDSRSLVEGVARAARRQGLLRAASAVFSTPPWGGVEQDEFLNATLVVSGLDTPGDWLRWGQDLENAADRTREVRWGPRTLDVDVVSARLDGVEVTSDDPTLTLPHPRAAERAFVLVPWLDADPDAVLAGVPVRDLIGGLDPADVDGVRRLADMRFDPR